MISDQIRLGSLEPFDGLLSGDSTATEDTEVVESAIDSGGDQREERRLGVRKGSCRARWASSGQVGHFADLSRTTTVKRPCLDSAYGCFPLAPPGRVVSPGARQVISWLCPGSDVVYVSLPRRVKIPRASALWAREILQA